MRARFPSRLTYGIRIGSILLSSLHLLQAILLVQVRTVFGTHLNEATLFQKLKRIGMVKVSCRLLLSFFSSYIRVLLYGGERIHARACVIDQVL